jgi:DegV family protein with EDD domain
MIEMVEAKARRLDRSNTAILVDSTADLPAYLADDPNVSMIPLLVHFGQETYRDWIDIRPEQFFAKLKASATLPTTSQPSVGAFIQEYQRHRATFDRVISLHISAALSGTVASAALAAEEVDRVTVIDTWDVSHSISLLTDRLLARLDRGTTDKEIADYVDHFRHTRGMLFLLDTLDYLYKGGRIGRASHLVGGLLNVKPMLTVREGTVEAYKKARGDRKALELMLAYFLELTHPGAPVYLALGQAGHRERVEELLGMLRATDREIDLRIKGEVGCVIGTYSGPGAVSMFFVQD